MNNIDSTLENPVKNETFLDRLRAGTAESHNSLEQLPVSLSITSADISNESYALYLDMMHDVIKQLEDKIYPVIAPIVEDLDSRIKLDLIEKDLAVLNHSKTRFSNPFGDDAKLNSLPYALGIMYVVEGSTLGGRYILKNIEAFLPYDETQGALYFAGYGNKTGSTWKNFLNVLISYEQENNAGDEIIAGADFAFQAIHNHLAAN